MGGVALDEIQRARLGALIACILRCDPTRPSADVVSHAERCLMATVLRVGDTFVDLPRVRMGTSLVRVSASS